MLDTAAEEEGRAIGIDPPDHRPDSKGWAFRRHDLELHRRSDFQPRLGPDLGSKRADVHGTRQIAGGSGVNDDGPCDASSGMLPPVFGLRGVHATEVGKSYASHRDAMNSASSLEMTSRRLVSLTPASGSRHYLSLSDDSSARRSSGALDRESFPSCANHGFVDRGLVREQGRPIDGAVDHRPEHLEGYPSRRKAGKQASSASARPSPRVRRGVAAPNRTSPTGAGTVALDGQAHDHPLHEDHPAAYSGRMGHVRQISIARGRA